MKSILLRALFVFMTLAPVFADANQGGKIPPLLPVQYAAKLSSEPVLVQRFAVSADSAATVNAAIVRALRNRGWEVTPAEGRIEAGLTHRAFDSSLTFVYTQNSVEIYSVSYRINKQGNRLRRDEPVSWIRNLHKDILANL